MEVWAKPEEIPTKRTPTWAKSLKAAKLMGVIPSVVFGGCMTLAVVVFTWFKAPSLRKFEY